MPPTDPEFRRRLRATFQMEAADHLRALTADLTALRQGGNDESAIERLYRGTHTLKGAARMVGELQAEALCHTLEQKLSRWKQGGAHPGATELDELEQAIGEVSRVLGVAVSPPLPTSTPAATPAVNPEPPANVRVAGTRLDALLMRAEELVGARLSVDQHIATMGALRDRAAGWKRELERVRASVNTLRRQVDAGMAGSVQADLTSLLHYLDWTSEYVRELNGDISRVAVTAALDQRRLGSLVNQVLDEAKELLMLPFSSLLASFPAFVQDAARQGGKRIDLAIKGAETEIDRRVLDEIRDALVHLVRNCVDHGLETAVERRAAGKPETGRLTIAITERAGGTVEIAVADDGRGIDAASVNTSARRLGLLASDAPDLPESEALALVFRSGFSTRAEPSDLSGRGLGLAIVREKAEQIGGTVSLESTPGRGSTFRLNLPLTLARFRGLFVSAHHQTFVIPSAYVRRVLRVPPSRLRRLKAQPTVDVDERTLPVVPLAQAVGLPPPDKPADAPWAYLVVIESGALSTAVRVDDVPSEHEIIMKGLGPMLRGAHQYVGATVLGGGRIVPVLNAGYLLAADSRGRRPSHPAATSTATRERRRRVILVVEDSITSRSLLKGILQGAGYDVRTAVDGADAMTVLKFQPVDLVVTDVQMPRLNGFELTARIRADAQLSTVPVILITSLASREDRERGVDAGANAYIVKSSFDQSDLLEAVGRLLP